MQEFVDWLSDEEADRIHPVELSALAHYKFVYIHPFIDGNGRTARLLMNLILMQVVKSVNIIPPPNQGPHIQYRHNYIMLSVVPVWFDVWLTNEPRHTHLRKVKKRR